ncbi:MAG: sigma-54-dependent Fis family transcriptional regulator [Phycisphaerales bacterium]|nr:MAG: sigma-54-dependent Fis family transcriptional regulator [Phycisphaerales bacterium]
MKAVLTTSERRFAASIAKLIYGNPFLPERIAREREALGDAFDESMADWNLRGEISADHANVRKLLDRCAHLAEAVRQRLKHHSPQRGDLELYEDLVLFVAYYRFRDAFDKVIESALSGRTTLTLSACYARFDKTVRHFLFPPHFGDSAAFDVAHLFALFFQIKRAFHFIFRNIIGTSGSAARFRAAAWQSIFTHDLRRYRTVLHDRMGDITTLITGPSGTGKELAARAIGMARYIPFDTKSRKFADEFHSSFHPVNLSALSPTLIESELFGHVRGAFTGAIEDHPGRLEECSGTGTVFLDEIGDLDPAIQVKLLRVLQDRSFRRVGDREDRRFEGKVIAATNRDLAEQMRAGRFREDLYYRLCADVVVAPSLEERLRDRPDELASLVRFIATRLVGSAGETLAEEVTTCIREQIAVDYSWPGNVRELEQCVRNVLVRGKYNPPQGPALSAKERLAQDVSTGSLTVDELMQQYCTLVYAQAGSYEEAARRLQVDRRTVKARMDNKLLELIRHRKSD